MFSQVSLQLYSAGLTTLQPGALGLMPYLEDLHLENNNITVIYNDSFVNCSKLLNLFLENNNIKVQNCSALQSWIKTLPDKFWYDKWWAG